MTNADKIRSMTNEELIKLLNFIGEGDSLCHYIGKEYSNHCSNPDLDMCQICVNKWLEAEYDKENKEKNKIPGIFCLNANCKHYFEDNCTKFFEKSTLNISADGKCKDFEMGKNEGYMV